MPSTLQKYTKVIAVDPGATSGIAACTLVPNPEDAPKLRVWPLGFSSIEVPDGIDGFSNWFASMSDEIQRNTLWVVERFDITKRTVATRVEYDALYIIGFLKGMQTDLVLRSPSARRVAKGKLFDWSNPTKDDHADDAAMHLKAYLVDTFPYLMDDLLFQPKEADDAQA